MAFSKVILNDEVLMDVTTDTVEASSLLSGKQATKNDGTKVSGSIASKGSADMTVSGATVTVPAGYYAADASASVATATQATPNISVNSTTGVITATATQTAGYIAAGTKSDTEQLTVQAAKTVSPTEEEQTAVTAGKYTTGAVKVAAIPSDYVGSGVTQRGAADLTASGTTITAPAGYYAESASKAVATTTHPNPTASVNSTTGLVTASHTQTTGYVTGGTTTGTLQLTTQSAKTVSPTESEQTAVAAGRYTTGAVKVGAISSTYVGSGIDQRDSTDLTASGATVTAPAGYYASAASKSVASGSAITPATTVTANPSISVNSSGLITATASATKSVTPTVSAGYVSSGTAGTITVSGSNTSQLTTQAAATITPSTSSQTAVAAGRYTTGAVTVAAMPSGTAGTPTVTKGTVSNNSVTVTPSVTNTTGYITGGTKNGTAVTVSASELVSGTKSITENGTGIDVTNYASVDVAVTTKHTATITQGTTGQTYVQYNGVTYRTVNSTFEFSAGDTCKLCAYNDMAGGNIYVDDVSVASTDRGTTYTYTLPDFDIELELSNGTQAYIKIYTISSSITVNPLSVTANGIYTAPTGTAYSPVMVNVESGGGSVSSNDVNFIDYDGTILYSYSVFDFMALTDMPANPTHNGLISQGWNWSLTDAKSQLTVYPKAGLTIGQMYVTSSGKSEIDISLNSEHLSPYLTIAVNGTVTVDWGDNSATNTVTGTSATTLKYTLHEYATAGDYTISISINSGYYTFYNTTNTKAAVLSAYASNSNRSFNKEYSGTIKAIRLGTGASIGYSAFCYCYALQSITIPNNVTSIGANAFAYCYALQSITIPDSVTSIGNGAFLNCYDLQSITMPDGVTSMGTGVFYNCYALQSITIPDGITSIGTNMFYYCYALQSITIPDSVTSIGSAAFYGCYALQSITIPDDVTSIVSNAFNNCYALQSITIPDGVTSIEGGAFNGCYGLQSITIPDSVTSIGTYAFCNCYALQSITIPDGVTSIGLQTFSGCSALRSITIPNSVTSIGNGAFSNCQTFQSITIPDDVTSIGTQAFYNCYAIEEYHLLPTTPPTLAGTNAFSGIVTGTVIYVPQGCLEAYQTATNWSTYASYMQEEA